MKKSELRQMIREEYRRYSLNEDTSKSIDKAIDANALVGDHIAKLLLHLDKTGKKNRELANAASLVDKIDQILARLNYSDFAK